MPECHEKCESRTKKGQKERRLRRLARVVGRFAVRGLGKSPDERFGQVPRGTVRGMGLQHREDALEDHEERERAEKDVFEVVCR